MSFVKTLMPDHVTSWTRVIAWINVIVNIGIVGTGGLVRLTGSGLGCPTWPLCTDDSLVPTPEMGIHGLIEFGNRTLTGVVVVAALLTFLAVFKTSRSGLGLVAPSVWVGVLIIVQAIVGGITVLVQLDPRIVGVHFLFSALIVSIAGMLLQRVRLAEQLPHGRPAQTKPAFWISAMVVAGLTWITQIVGVLTTGAGPHAGDTIAARNGLDAAIMQHVHAWPGYALAAALAVFLIITLRGQFTKTNPLAIMFAIVIVVQILIGVYQARNGLPIWSVTAHMVLAVGSLAIMSALLVTARREAIQRADSESSHSNPGRAHRRVAAV